MKKIVKHIMTFTVAAAAFAFSFSSCSDEIIGKDGDLNPSAPTTNTSGVPAPSAEDYSLNTLGAYTEIAEDGYTTLSTPTGETKWKYISFGTFPQTKKADSVTVAEDDEHKITQGEYDYYLGSDNYYYLKQGDNWYRVEPIIWRMIDGQKKMLLAERKLIALQWHQWHPDDFSHSISGTTIYKNNYKYSNARAYLNGYSNVIGDYEDNSWTGKGFIDIAFTEEQKAKIKDTVVDNHSSNFSREDGKLTEHDGTNQYACEDTTDKVFLASVDDITNTDYGFDQWDCEVTTEQGESLTRKRYVTDFSVATGADDDEVYDAKWFLRDPLVGADNDVWAVKNNGNVYLWGPTYTNNEHGAIVPALCVN